ncbi:MAG: choice-of-anchor D domain-containing protein [Treponema sp.]|nr:choice-of-anchor D domain-containing protein [Treponema sp.]
MKKLFAAVICFAAILAACEQPTVDIEEISPPTLTIRNESSHDLSDVGFADISFASSGNNLPVSAHATRQLTAENTTATGRITFTRNDIGITLRTDAISIDNRDFTFTFTDNTVVEELANTSNRRPLGQISFLSQLAVERGGLQVARGDIVNLGDSVVSTTRPNVFNIRNAGVGRLLFGTIEPVQIAGDTYNAFTVVQPAGAEVAPGAAMPFTINFTPRAPRAYSATVTIRSNDQSGDHVFTINAAGVAPRPIATVVHASEEIEQYGTINAGEAFITLSTNINIGIGNAGTEVLTVDTAGITITGSHASAFSLSTLPGGNISMGGQSSLIVNFSPEVQGENNAILTIPTNDGFRNPITVFLRATARLGSAVPELRQGNTVIANNTFTPHDFGQVTVGTGGSSLVFTIRNTGNVALVLTGNPAITSTNAVFSISNQPASTTIGPGQEVPFIIQYTPTTEGQDNATISFVNNSSDMLFSFPVRGTGHIPRPQISVQQRAGAEVTPNGEANFGNVAIGEEASITFYIMNTGDASLSAAGASWVSIAGNEDGHFAVTGQPSNAINVAPGGTASFTVRYRPTTAGSNLNALVQISTNSRDNGVFSFTVRGDSFERRSQVTLQQGGDPITPHGIFDIGRVAIGDQVSIDFTIGNAGDANLSATAGASWVSIADNEDGLFAVTGQPSTALNVVPGGTTTFTIRYIPEVTGAASATVRVHTNSRDNGVFSFTITGTGFERQPRMTLSQDETDIPIFSEFDFGNVDPGETLDITFTIGNAGEANMTFVDVDGNRVNILDNTDDVFSVIQQPSAAQVVAPGNTVTFVLRFNPLADGQNYFAKLEIQTNSEAPVFSFFIRGRGEARIFQIGDIGPGGGIVFFDAGVDMGGWRFLEAAPVTQNATWGAIDFSIWDTGFSIGSGRQNTQILVEHLNGRGETGTAAQLAVALEINGFNDWFLPSRDELLEMAANSGILEMGSQSWYWSSSASTRAASTHFGVTHGRFAWAVSGGGNFNDSGERRFTNRVRAIRAF